MPLDPATFLTLAAQCAPAVAPSTLLALARVESGLDPLAIGVNGVPALRIRARTAEEAAKEAHALIAAGRSVDLGLGQINARNLGRLRLSVREAFEPCRNLAAAAQVLGEGYRRAGADGQAGLRIALSL
jgi:type IV secretion system protein VirB1